MAVIGLFVKKLGAYVAGSVAGAFIKIRGQYALIDQAVLVVKANGVYDFGTGFPPTLTFLPHLLGLAQVGATLTVVPGQWGGNPPAVLSYRWYADGLVIMGEIGTTHVVTPQDAGHTITVHEIATNTAGSSSAAAPESKDIPALAGFDTGFGPGFGA